MPCYKTLIDLDAEAEALAYPSARAAIPGLRIETWGTRLPTSLRMTALVKLSEFRTEAGGFCGIDQDEYPD
jgi:hypothetical protein